MVFQSGTGLARGSLGRVGALLSLLLLLLLLAGGLLGGVGGGAARGLLVLEVEGGGFAGGGGGAAFLGMLLLLLLLLALLGALLPLTLALAWVGGKGAALAGRLGCERALRDVTRGFAGGGDVFSRGHLVRGCG